MIASRPLLAAGNGPLSINVRADATLDVLIHTSDFGGIEFKRIDCLCCFLLMRID
jgi:hypothetical protein